MFEDISEIREARKKYNLHMFRSGVSAILMMCITVLTGISACTPQTSVQTETSKPIEIVTPIPEAATLTMTTSCLDGQVSLNGRYYACRNEAIVGTVADGKSTEIDWPKWSRFEGWTADSRYALYTVLDQYGNQVMAGFDTQEWSPFTPFPFEFGCMVNCYDSSVVAIAPLKAQILSANGVLFNLPNSQKNVLDRDQDHVALANWSPDGAYLAFVGCAHSHDKASLYLAHGDGEQVKKITSIECPRGSHLNWSTDGRKVVMKADSNCYILNAVTKEIQVEPISGLSCDS